MNIEKRDCVTSVSLPHKLSDVTNAKKPLLLNQENAMLSGVRRVYASAVLNELIRPSKVVKLVEPITESIQRSTTMQNKCLWVKCKTKRNNGNTVFCAKHQTQLRLAKTYIKLEKDLLKYKSKEALAQ